MLQEKIYQKIHSITTFSPLPVKNIIFDIGMVLVDFCWQSFLKSHFCSEEIIERLSAAIFQNDIWCELDRTTLPPDEILHLFLQNDPGLKEEITDCFYHLGDTIEVYPHSIPLIEKLKEDGFSIYYLSNYSRHLYEQTKEKLHSFTDLMHGGIFSFEVEMVKPEEEIYRTLLSKYSLHASECLFIDDNSKNIRAAAKCNIQGLLFRLSDYV